jgi:hypothetical protein
MKLVTRHMINKAVILMFLTTASMRASVIYTFDIATASPINPIHFSISADNFLGTQTGPLSMTPFHVSDTLGDSWTFGVATSPTLAKKDKDSAAALAHWVKLVEDYWRQESGGLGMVWNSGSKGQTGPWEICCTSVLSIGVVHERVARRIRPA